MKVQAINNGVLGKVFDIPNLIALTQFRNAYPYGQFRVVGEDKVMSVPDIVALYKQQTINEFKALIAKRGN